MPSASTRRPRRLRPSRRRSQSDGRCRRSRLGRSSEPTSRYASARRRPGARGLRGDGPMSFERPWLLLALLALPLLAWLYIVLQRRRAPVRGELHEPRGARARSHGAGRGGGTSPPVLLLLALAALFAGVRAPARARPRAAGPRDGRARARRLRARWRRATSSRPASAPRSRDQALPRSRSGTTAGRDGRLRRRAAGRVAADDRPRAGERVARQPRRLRDLRRHGDRRRARLAVDLGRETLERGPRRRGDGAGRQATRELEARLDPLPLRRRAARRRAPAARGRAARKGGGRCPSTRSRSGRRAAL